MIFFGFRYMVYCFEKLIKHIVLIASISNFPHILKEFTHKVELGTT